MPDVLHWLGISKIDRFVSMSNMKHDAVVRAGIEIVERVPIPDALIPLDARVEMDAKMAAGYFTEGAVPDGNELAQNQRPRARWLSRLKRPSSRAGDASRHYRDDARARPQHHRARGAARSRISASNEARCRRSPSA